MSASPSIPAQVQSEPLMIPSLLASPKSLKGRKLAPKVQKFIAAYIATGNATTAALQAGYAPKSAYQAGSRLTKRKHVRAEIDALLQRAADENGLSIAYVLKRFKEIADAEDTRNADRVAALSYIGKHLNMFTERREIDAKITITVERIGG
jgi:phage terminase small subunit